jgi:hypothetical protein
MHISSTLLSAILEGALGVALIVWISLRQLRWTAVVPSRMWRMPAILAIIGVVTVARAHTSVTATDLALLALEAVLALGTGVAMGVIDRFRPISADAAAAVVQRRPGTEAPRYESSTGWIGVVLWLVVIAARVGIGFWGHALGSTLIESTGVILVVVALNRVASAAVVLTRLDRHHRALVS